MSPEIGQATSFGVGIMSSVLSGIAIKDEGKQEQAGYDYNASIDLQNAGNEVVSTEQRYSQLVGKQAAAYSAAGVDITRGSPLLMMAATAGRGGRQAEQIMQSGTEAANLETYYGKIAAWRGTVGGLGAFLSGIGKSASVFAGSQGASSGSDNVDWSQVDAPTVQAY